MRQKETQKVFKEHPLLQIVHHKGDDLQNVHISYVTRTNALPLLLEKALLAGYDKYVFEYKKEMHKKPVSLPSIFLSHKMPVCDKNGESKKYFIEIGFGNGENSFKIALSNPNINYLAFDVYLKGVAEYVNRLLQSNLDNVLVCRYDAEDFIINSVEDGTIDGFNIFFPDPWIKRKQNKRRIINQFFVKTLSSKLKTGGVIHTATDIKEYADVMMEVLSSEKTLENIYGNAAFAPNKINRFTTSFEEKGRVANRQSYDLIFKRV